MALNWKQWSIKDIIYGIIVPVVVVLAIVGISKISSIVGYSSASAGIVIGINYGAL